MVEFRPHRIPVISIAVDQPPWYLSSYPEIHMIFCWILSLCDINGKEDAVRAAKGVLSKEQPVLFELLCINVLGTSSHYLVVVARTMG